MTVSDPDEITRPDLPRPPAWALAIQAQLAELSAKVDSLAETLDSVRIQVAQLSMAALADEGIRADHEDRLCAVEAMVVP